jgi:predicted subunit of tRNA(5-methylaminomethyl-2-thiouridylate) methyltransferase
MNKKAIDRLLAAQLAIAQAIDTTDIPIDDEIELRHMLQKLPHILARLEGKPVDMTGAARQK